MGVSMVRAAVRRFHSRKLGAKGGASPIGALERSALVRALRQETDSMSLWIVAGGSSMRAVSGSILDRFGRRRPSVGSVAARGGAAGALATVAMSGAMLAGQALGLMGTAPPKQITATAAHRAGALGALPTPAFKAGWVAAHLLYGMVCGVGYSLLHRVTPRLPRHPLGLAYGLVVWAASYFGLLPALGLYPEPEDDASGRIATMIGAHLVFGVSLAELDRRLHPLI